MKKSLLIPFAFLFAFLQLIRQSYLDSFRLTMARKRFSIAKKNDKEDHSFFGAVRTADQKALSTGIPWHVIEFTKHRYTAISSRYKNMNSFKILYTTNS